ncbi:MAG: helix-turn-helix transcriptional regulator [Clostridia bacterium]|nr:helix-turn-helix transcriptional regulator [Clostridia bacterium]
MQLTVSEKIRIILGRRNLTITDLAAKLGTSRQNLTNKLNRDNFTEKDIMQIAAALNCTYESLFTLNDTGETV